jgi:hypothetical protein
MSPWPTNRREATRPGRARFRGAAAVTAAALAIDSVLALFACGGTTGRPEIAPADPDDAGPDSTLGDASTDGPPVDGGEAGDDGGLYTGLFDVAIVYTDRDLPDIAPAPNAEAGVDGGGYPFPTNCPPYITVNGKMPVPISYGGNDEVPADSTSDGGETFAADGSACLYPWLGSKSADECVTPYVALNQAQFPAFPPCNWCPPGSGMVVQGPNPGEDRTLACWTLYQCILQSQCYLGSNGAESCLCGSEALPACQTDPHPSGPCASEELEALETTDPDHALAYFTVGGMPVVSGSTGSGGTTCGSYLNSIYAIAAGDGCFPLGDQ